MLNHKLKSLQRFLQDVSDTAFEFTSLKSEYTAIMNKCFIIFKRKSVIFLSIFTLFIASCKTKDTFVKKKIIKCTNESYNKNLSNGFGVSFRDYYKHILVVENVFISEGILKSKNKENYLLLSKSINKSLTKEKALKIINLINLKLKQTNLPKFNNIISNSGVSNCIFTILRDEKYKTNNFLQNIAYSYSEFEKYGYNNQKALTNMFKNINSEEFNDIVYRSYCDLIIYLIILDKSEEL